MAKDIIYRIKDFSGGITDDVRDKISGVFTEMTEVEIFDDPPFVKPSSILGADSVIANRVTGYDLDNQDNLYAHSIGTTAAPTIYKKTSASADSPGSWASYEGTSAGSRQSPIKWHQYSITVSSIIRATTTATLTTDSTHGLSSNDVVVIKFATESNFNGTFTIATAPTTTTFTYTVSDTGSTSETSSPAEVFVGYLYIHRPLGLLRTITPSNPSFKSVDRAGTSMILPGYLTESDRTVMIRMFSELHIGCGQFISTIDETGVFIPKSFTIPDGWKIVSVEQSANYMAILAQNENRKYNTSKIFFWDLTATTGVLDTIDIPMGGPQIIFNYDNFLWVVCAMNNFLILYRVNANNIEPFIMLDDIPNESDDVGNGLIPTGITPESSKFKFEDSIFFGVMRNNKSGLYQLSKTSISGKQALVLSKLLKRTGEFTAKPYAAFAAGPNIYASYAEEDGEPFDTTKDKIVKLENNNSPTFSSLATIETITLDGNIPETLKEWTGFITITEPLPDDTAVRVDARSDDKKEYNITISSLTRASTTATAVTSSDHNLETGDMAEISGATQTEYNGTFEVTVTDATTFTYTVSGSPATPATGSPVLVHSYDPNSYFKLTNSNDQVESGATSDTYWRREITSILGRASQWRIRFISDGSTNRPSLIVFSPISKEGFIHG